MEVIILRGLPGAGKDTWIVNTFPNIPNGPKVSVCSADQWHVKNGLYEFKVSEGPNAHNYCTRLYADALMHSVRSGIGSPDFLIVNNTNTCAWEISPYYRLAEAFNIKVKIVRIHCEFRAACSRNIHKVPATTIWSMYQNLINEKLPSWWNEEIIVDPIYPGLSF